MSDPMTLREQVARAMWEVRRREVLLMTQRQDQGDAQPWGGVDIGDYENENNSANVLSEADSAIRIVTEACAKVAEDTADDSVDGASIARRIRQMGKP